MIEDDDRLDGVIGSLIVASDDREARRQHREAVADLGCAHYPQRVNGRIELLYCKQCKSTVDRLARSGREPIQLEIHLRDGSRVRETVAAVRGSNVADVVGAADLADPEKIERIAFVSAEPGPIAA